jgi:hypothetical protein
MLSGISHKGNANQNYEGYYFTTTKMVILKTQIIKSVDKDVEKSEPHTLLTGA